MRRLRRSHRDVVFLGPSLGLERARSVLPADYRPPARMGSVVQACRDGATRLGIVDGYYETVPAVWHKEILYALAEGVEVFGAASMGALRAAELDRFGMVGVGTVYGWYRDSVVTADDEVSLMHGPAASGYPALSVPLVDIRATLARAVQENVVASSTRDAIISCARRKHYPDRSYPELVAEAVGDPALRTRLLTWLAQHSASQKQQDAVDMLATMAAAKPGAHRARVRFEQTWNWQALLQDVAHLDDRTDRAGVLPGGQA